MATVVVIAFHFYYNHKSFVTCRIPNLVDISGQGFFNPRKGDVSQTKYVKEAINKEGKLSTFLSFPKWFNPYNTAV